MKKVYMDYAATTFVRPEVIEAMLPYFGVEFYNPSSLYSFSDHNKEAIATARRQVADAINASPDEIYFTGGGSEADNWALKGTAWAFAEKKGKHLITSCIEHHAILHSMDFLKRQGFDVTFLPVDSEGFVKPEVLRAAMRPDTSIVSIMFANNEIGTIEPIKELAAVAHEFGALFHTDAVQAVTHTPIDVKDLGVDMLSSAGHKFYAPKGVGFLYIRKGLKIENLIHGGGQEKSRRAGTENVAGIVAIGKAIELASAGMDRENARLAALRDKLIDGILTAVPHAKLNGSRTSRLPGNANFSFVGIEGETMLLDLDDAGIAASTGSACASASLDPSHVLMSIGLKHEQAHGSIRLTMGHGTTEDDVDYVLETLPQIVKRRREMSPLWSEYLESLKGGKDSCSTAKL